MSHRQSLHPEDGDNNVLRNVGILPRHYTCHNPEDVDMKLQILRHL